MKKLVLYLLVFAGAAIAWYLFIKKYDYEFRFTVQSGPAAVYKELETFNYFDPENALKPETGKGVPYKNLIQEIEVDSAPVILDWEFEHLNDSLTKVKLNTLRVSDNLPVRLDILNPFKKSSYLQNLRKELIDLVSLLQARQKTYKVKLEGTAQSPEYDCVCVDSNNIMLENKALEMMAQIDIIDNYFVENKLSIRGNPFLKINEWDVAKEIISFSFCFPINSDDNPTETELVKIRRIPSKKGLRANFYGNYRQSHLGWYELLEKSKRENIMVITEPLEIFHNNPRMGEDAIKWKAEIYLPIQE